MKSLINVDYCKYNTKKKGANVFAPLFFTLQKIENRQKNQKNFSISGLFI